MRGWRSPPTDSPGDTPGAVPKPGPGMSLDQGTSGTKTIGLGNQGPGGAVAYASRGNAALAISFGLSPVGSVASVQGGKYYTAFALEGQAFTGAFPGGYPSGAAGNNNSAVAVGGANFIGTGDDNHTFTAHLLVGPRGLGKPSGPGRGPAPPGDRVCAGPQGSAQDAGR